MLEPTPQFTPVEVRAPAQKLLPGQLHLGLGSCFAESMATRLREHGQRSVCNPVGTLYNPASISQAIDLALAKSPPTADSYGHWQDRWFHPLLGSRMAAANLEQARLITETALRQLADALQSCNWLLLTFGSAVVHIDRQTGQIVGNCQQRPRAQFTTRRLSPHEITEHLAQLRRQLLAVNPQLNLVMTVSPVRHVATGMVDHQRSKACLLLACAELETQDCHYFPAYEIFMDELRDYRWYAEDMLHPSAAAIDLVWRRFVGHCCSPQLQQQIVAADKLHRSLQHRFRCPGTASAHAYCEARENAVEMFLREHPDSDPTPWRQQLVALRARCIR